MRTLLAREPQAQPGRVGGAENHSQSAKRIKTCLTIRLRIHSPELKEHDMTAPMMNGTQQRKSLSQQLDRLDSILDGLADSLNGAVADAVRDAVGQAVT